MTMAQGLFYYGLRDTSASYSEFSQLGSNKHFLYLYRIQVFGNMVHKNKG